MSGDDYFGRMRTPLSLTDERFNAALHDASGNPDRIGEILRSLSDREILVQRALLLLDDVRAALEAELARREGERIKRPPTS